MKSFWEKWKKAAAWRPEPWQLAVLSLILLAALLVPVLRICRYTTPWYDDYSYGNATKNFLVQEYSLKSALQGVWFCVKGMWYAWQGTFSSVFFMALVPCVWGEQYYFLGPLFLVILLVTAVFVLVRTLVKDVLRAPESFCIVLPVFTAVMALELLHSIRAGLFWYNSGVHYIGMHSFFLLFTASMIQILQAKRKGVVGTCLVLSLLGAVLSSGANFVTALQGMVMVVSLLGLGALLRRKRTFLLLPAGVLYAAGLYLNVSAPGNEKRQAFYTGVRLEAPTAVLRSFLEAFRHIGIFTDWMMVILCIVAVPLIWQMIKKLRFSFRFPGLVLLWSFCFYATGFTPSLYAMGNAGLGRTLNAVKLTYQILVLVNEVYWLGWLEEKLETGALKQWTGKVHFTFYAVCILCMLAVFCRTFNPQGEYTSYGAYYFVHTGEAYNFYQEYLKRVEVLKGKGKDIVVEPYQWNPWLIRVGELSADPSQEENRFIAQWYGKDSVSCIAKEQEE